MLPVEKLHAAIFGSHYHPCPSERCGGKQRPCSEQYDCQPVAKLCYTCSVLADDFDLPETVQEDLSDAAIAELRKL